KALEYVRFRNDGQGDVGRTERTRNFLKAVVDGAKNNGKISQLPAVWSSLAPYVKTDLDSGTVASLARMANKVDSSKIHMDIVPGSPVILKNGPWVWQADVPKTQALVDAMIKMKAPAPEPQK
ncbi:MAG TPA: LCP family protein, partial [Symbiobacteriaceae bacterium]|nr:LCP family protein [Symbiobacteriaceae bacterium]